MTNDIISTKWWKSFWPSGFEAGLTWLSIFALPWQLRHALYLADYGGNYFEYSSIYIYATDILMAGLLVMWAVRGAKNTMVPKLIWRPLVLWLAWITIGSWSGVDWQTSLQQVAHYWLMAGWLMYLANNINQINQLIGPLVWGAGLQALIGAGQFWLNRDLGLRWLTEPPLGPNIGGVMVVGDEVNRQIRSYGLLPHPNVLSGLLVVAILPLMKLMGEAALRYRGWLLSVAALFGLTLGFAFSRMGWLMAVAMLAIAVWLAVTRKAWRASGWAIAVMVIAMGGALWWQWPNVVGRFELDSRLEAKSVSERIVGLQTWGQVMTGHELSGVGVSNYASALIQLTPNQSAWTYKPVHDIYLLLAAETGVVGLAIWLWLVGVGLWLWFRLVRTNWGYLWVGMPMIALLGLGVLDHWAVSFQQGRLLIFFALALIILEDRLLWRQQTKLI